MSRVIATIFLSIYLISTSELDQLMKLPLIFQHYHEHIRMEGPLSFRAFLVEHYLESDPKDPDYTRDMQLPFKTHSHSFFMLMPVAPPKLPLTGLQVVSYKLQQQFPLITEFHISTGFHTGIFQPPRLA